MMKPDFYTKAVLTVIALLLAAITWSQFRPELKVYAQTKGPLDGVQYGGYVAHYGHVFFDKQSGDLWRCSPTQAADARGNYHQSGWEWSHEGTFTKLGN